MSAVIGLAPERVVEACAEAAAASGEVVSAANFNSPEQTVIAGSAAGVAKAGETSSRRRAPSVSCPLPVSAPFHCALMKPAEEKLSPFLDGTAFSPLAIPVVNNVDAGVETDPGAAREALRRQVCSPVRWVESVQRLSALASSAIEVGPATVLSGLARRIAKDWPVKTTSTAAALDALT